MSDTLHETGTPDPLAPPEAPADPPAAEKPKAKAPAKRKPAAKKPAAKKPAATKTAKVKFVGAANTVCDSLGHHGYPTLCVVGKVYELPQALAEGLLRSSRHFEPAK